MENSKIESTSNGMPNFQGNITSQDSSDSKNVSSKSLTSKDISRALPNNTDAEKGVLSAMLQSPDEIATEAVQVLDPNAFYVPSHKCTSAELEPKIKNSLSHRGQALRKFIKCWNNLP